MLRPYLIVILRSWFGTNQCRHGFDSLTLIGFTLSKCKKTGEMYNVNSGCFYFLSYKYKQNLLWTQFFRFPTQKKSFLYSLGEVKSHRSVLWFQWFERPIQSSILNAAGWQRPELLEWCKWIYCVQYISLPTLWWIIKFYSLFPSLCPCYEPSHRPSPPFDL